MGHRVNQLENYALQEQYNPRTGDWLRDTKHILLRFLQDLYFQAPPGQSCFHFEPGRRGQQDYTTDEKETELIITDQSPVNTDTVEKRPVIILSRGPFAYGNTSLDQLRNLSFADGKRTHTDILSGSFVMNCVAPEGLEAERLAVITAKAVRFYRRNLQKAGFFHIGHLVQVGTETPPGTLLSGDSASDYVNVPVTFPVYYQEEWTVEQDAQVVNKMVFKSQVIFKKFDGSLLVPDAINPDGTPNESSEGVIVSAWTVPPAIPTP